MILDNFKNTQIFKDTNLDFQKEFFDLKPKKVLHNIDTLYVTASVSNWSNADKFLTYIDGLKSMIEFEPIYVPEIDLFATNLTFVNYKYALEKKDCFVLFFAKNLTSDCSPPIFVQIRSEFLWLNGEHECLRQVHDCLNTLLLPYELKIIDYRENRIDYAYHTNYIRNLKTFFSDLNAMQVSKFDKFGIVGSFVGDNETDYEYLSMGIRASNNIFVRIYNKTKEVCDKGYKQFFLEFWFKNNMISLYDKLIYEQCFLVGKGGFRKSPYFRLEFYVRHGNDVSMKVRALDMINNPRNYEYDDVVALADTLTPRLTMIVNIEFQTKRRFYNTFDSSVLNLLQQITPSHTSQLDSLFKLLDNKVLIHRVLTEDVLRLVDKNDNKSRKREKKILPLWQLIQDCKMENSNIEGKMLRQYQRSLDISKIKNRLLSSMASFSIYLNNENENNIMQDSLQFLSFLNENDLDKALKYKKQKAPQLKSKLETTYTLEVESRFSLLDREDGTYID